MDTYKSIAEIKSEVVHGTHLGRTVGMPTANFDASKLDESVLPEDGVYGSIVTLPDGVQKFGVTNIGTKPSVDVSGDRNVETHILDFDGDLYGQILSVNIVKRIRDIQKFNSLEEVKVQVDKDKL